MSFHYQDNSYLMLRLTLPRLRASRSLTRSALPTPLEYFATFINIASTVVRLHMNGLKSLCRVEVATSIFAIVFSVVPSFGQERDPPKRLLMNVTGSAILDELRLREAATIRVKPEGNEWAKNVEAESLYGNSFAKLGSDELSTQVKESKLKSLSTPFLFDELRRRASETKLINGPDDRQDLFRIEARRAELAAAGGDTAFLDSVLKNAPAVCCLVKASRLNETAAGTLKMFTIPFADSQHDTIRLCTEERFFTQPTGAFCTGFLVAPDVIVTAGHCIKESDLPTARFVFGFRMTNPSVAITTFPQGDVYRGTTIISRVLDEMTGEDYAVVRLDRAVANVAPLKFRTAGRIADSTDIYVIGFPSGLPCKVSDNARVSGNSDTFVFNGNLDTYGGNSGSPVFNRVTHEVEGILVRGGKDFEFVADTLSGCIRSVVLADSEGNEACTRATVWAGKVPAPH